MNKYIDKGQVNVENLTQAWREQLAVHYLDKPRLCLLLTNSPLTFETEGESLMILLDVANDAQKEWLEILEMAGIPSRVCKGAGEAIEFVENML